MEPTSFELTLEQQFEMRRMQSEVQHMSREQALDLLLQASRLLMLKDNVIRNLIKQTPIQSLG
jgi:Phycobilisome degradation protein nblA